MSAWPDWLKIIQLKPRFLFGLWFLGALFLFLPATIADTLGIQEIRTFFRGWIGVGTLAAFAFWCVQLIPLYQTKRNAKKYRERVIQSVSSLSPDEWLLVAYCLYRNQQTITLEITHRSANALVAKGIMIMASGMGNQLAWPFTIPSFLWEYIKSNRQVVFSSVNEDDPRLQARFEELNRHIRRHDF